MSLDSSLRPQPVSMVITPGYIKSKVLQNRYHVQVLIIPLLMDANDFVVMGGYKINTTLSDSTSEADNSHGRINLFNF